jgi:hypothetical protein
MKKSPDSGHNTNIANFYEAISICKGIGADYKPTNTHLKIVNMDALYAQANAAKLALDIAVPAYTLAVSTRETTFEKLPKLVTRVGNALRACDIGPEIHEDLKSIIRKFRGSKKKKTEEGSEGTEETHHSDSQKSYNNLVSHFNNLIQLLTLIPGYQPEETELTVASLTEFYEELFELNQTVVDVTQPVITKRDVRNSILYTTGIGLVDTVQKVKTYVKSILGADNIYYKKLTALKFTRPSKMDPNWTFTLVMPS